VTVYVLAIVASALFAAGSVVQQRAASHAPPDRLLSYKLLLWLVNRPLWLLGIGVSALGNIASAIALGTGNPALVQPLQVTKLLFALPLAAAWVRRAVPGRDWAGAVATAVGLAIFILAGQPRQGDTTAAPPLDWAIVGGTIVVLALAFAAIGRRLEAIRAAPLLAAGAGFLFGLQGALTHEAIEVLRVGGLVAMVSNWQPYGVLVCALFGIVLIQSAYNLAPLSASFPAVVVAEPLAAIAIGVGVQGGVLNFAPATFALALVGLVIMIGGVWVLATSPFVTGQLDLLERRREEGLAYRAEEILEHDLQVLNEELDQLEAGGARPSWAVRSRQHLQRHIERIDEELARLRALQDDIKRHRDAERERERARTLTPEEREEFERYDHELSTMEEEIDGRARRLEEWSLRLQRRVEQLGAGRGGEEASPGGG
jgi:hypothetical protein